MPSRQIIGFAGNLARPSRTRALVETVTAVASERLGYGTQVFDVVDLGPSLGAAQRVDALPPSARRIVDAIVSADLLVVGSPTYKGGYSGLFKHLFDLLDPLSLAGKPVILTATGGGDRHALVVEHQLRPLFGFFAAHTAPTGIYATERDFRNGQPASGPVLQRVHQSVAEVSRLLTGAEPLLIAAE